MKLDKEDKMELRKVNKFIAGWEYFLETLDSYGGNLVILVGLLGLVVGLMTVDAIYAFEWHFVSESWWIVLGATLQALKSKLSLKDANIQRPTANNNVSVG